jgi:UDP-N-acetylglucosamine 4-epimerase
MTDLSKISTNEAEERAQSALALGRTFLITGVAGFIGSNLLEALLVTGNTVVGLDDFSNGSRENLAEVAATVGEKNWRRFRFMEGDIRDVETCSAACEGVQVVLHQAAKSSVPDSIADPSPTNEVNITGTLNMLLAAKAAGVERFIYASTSAVYGNSPETPNSEEAIGSQLSTYAVTKLTNELYASMFSSVYGLHTIGLRYFNVFGPKQDPSASYAAVIPVWVREMILGNPCLINGDGSATRDFCYIKNVIQAIALASVASRENSDGQVFNIALDSSTSLNDLFEHLRFRLLSQYPHLAEASPAYREARAGDLLHSRADISKARTLLGYRPVCSFADGLEKTIPWLTKKLADSREKALA